MRRMRQSGGGYHIRSRARAASSISPITAPTDIAGLQFWLDPSDAGSIGHTGGLVNTITNKGALGGNATSSSTLRPVTGTRTLNSLNSIDFSTGQNLILPAGLLTIANGPNTLFFVFASDNAGDATQNLVSGRNASAAFRAGCRFTTTQTESVNRTTSLLTTNLANTRDTTTKSAGYRRTGTKLLPFVSGAQGTDAANSENMTALTDLSIGSQDPTATINRFDGRMGEVLWYNNYVSYVDMNRIGAYLNRWGMTWAAMSFD